MTAQTLDRVLTAYRIGDPRGAHPIFDATGSRLFPGRWTTETSPVIYTSEHYSTAMLENLVNGSGELPPNQHFIEITISNGVSCEVFDTARFSGWADGSATETRAYGATWHASKRSLLLIVPSAVARTDNNVLINPDHPEFRCIAHSQHQPVWWDARLYATQAKP